MCESQYNPDDPLFLFSCSLDAEPQEQERSSASGLDDALDASPSVRAEADELRAVHRLVGRWARRPVELDWEHYTALIKARVESDTDAEGSEEIDRLLKRWGRGGTSLDAEAFTASVMGRVAPRRGRISWSAPLLKLGVPLAAAAAVALVVFGTIWFTPPREPFVRIVYRSRAPSSAGSVQPENVPLDSGHMPRVVVSYARGLDGEAVAAKAPSGVSLGTVGSPAIYTLTEELPPI